MSHQPAVSNFRLKPVIVSVKKGAATLNFGADVVYPDPIRDLWLGADEQKLSPGKSPRQRKLKVK